MKNIKSNPYQQELIGNDVSVVKSTHSGYLRVDGKIIDETMKTLRVHCKDAVKTVPKNGNVFDIKFKNGSRTIVGDRLMFRSEDRIKRLG
ncbi:MAG: ribonuclease P protein subunit [Thermoplasmata archaeon]